MLDLAFLACGAYVAVETVLLLSAVLLGRKIPAVRLVTYVVMLVAATFLGLLAVGGVTVG